MKTYIKTYISEWKKLPRSIAKEYRSGDSIDQIAVRHKTYTSAVRTALRHYKVKMRPPGSLAKGQVRGIQKLSEQDVRVILELDNMNERHTDIARKFNVSRERIRQICFFAGHPTRRSRMIPKVYILHEERMARKLKRQAKILEISKAWKAGMSLPEIGMLLGNPTPSIRYSQARIGYYRDQYGTRMFPYRRKNHWRLRTVEEQAKHIRNMAQEWNTHANVHRIQKLFGYASYNSAATGIQFMRRKYPDLFRTKEDILKQKVGELTQLRVVK